MRGFMGRKKIPLEVRQDKLEQQALLAQRQDATWSVYVLLCWSKKKKKSEPQVKSYYVGITTDIVRRVKQHQDGVAAAYTRSRSVCDHMVFKRGLTMGEALSVEHKLKRLSHNQKNELWMDGQGVWK